MAKNDRKVKHVISLHRNKGHKKATSKGGILKMSGI